MNKREPSRAVRMDGELRSLGDSNFNPGIKSALVQAKLPKGLRQLPLGEGTVVPLGVVLHE